MAESEEELKSLLMRIKEESEKAGLKLSIKNTEVMASSSITSWQIEGEKVETVTDFIVLGFKITVRADCSHKIKRCLLLGRKAMTNLDRILKRDITLLTKVFIVESMVFFSSHVRRWELDHKEGWALRNWCFQIVLEKTDSAVDCKVFKLVNPKGNQPWLFNGRTVREALILWPPDTKSRLTGEDPYAGEDWRQKEKRAAECVIVW